MKEQKRIKMASWMTHAAAHAHRRIVETRNTPPERKERSGLFIDVEGTAFNRVGTTPVPRGKVVHGLSLNKDGSLSWDY